MTKEELLEHIDHIILRTMMLSADLSQTMMLTPGDETSRKMRHVFDTLRKVQNQIEMARSQAHEIGVWE